MNESARTVGGRARLRAAFLLIALGVAGTIAALFPPYYLNGTSLAGDPGNLWFNIPTIVGWAAAAVMLRLPSVAGVGVGVAIGVMVVDLAYQAPDMASVIVGNNHVAAGFVLGNIGSVLCVLGSVVALTAIHRRSARPDASVVSAGWAPSMVLCGILYAAALVLPEISYSRDLSAGVFTRTGRASYTTTCCSPFHHRASYQVASTICLIVLALIVPFVAGRLRRRTLGLGLFIGTGIGLAANSAFWAAYLATAEVTPALFGFTDAQVSQYGVTVAVHPASGYWLGACATVALLIAAIRHAPERHAAAARPAGQPVGGDPQARGQRWAIGAGVAALLVVAVGAPAAGHRTYANSSTPDASTVVSSGGAGTSSGGGSGLSGGLTSLPGLSATAVCRDGTLSYSAHHQGTCSHHGGVGRWLDGVPPAVTVQQPTPSAVPTFSAVVPSATALPPTGIDTTPAALPALAVTLSGSAAAEPRAREVQQLMSRFLGSIDAGEYASAFAMMTADEQLAVGGEEAFAAGNSTSQDDDVQITIVDSTPGAGVVAQLSFRSQQAGSKGPRPGETCTQWALAYTLKDEPGGLRIDRVTTVSSTACVQASATASAPLGDLVAASLPLVPCPTSFGVDESPAPGLPRTMAASVPRDLVTQLAAYSDTDGIMQLLGPRGWQCSASYGADGAGGVLVYPPGALTTDGQLSPSAQAIVGSETSACLSCAEEQACPLFAQAAADYETDYQTACPARPVAESVTQLSSGVVGFEDPPGTQGSGEPSGRSYPANGVITYHSGDPAGSWLETCTLPEGEHAVCTAVLNTFVNAYGGQ